MIPAVRSQPTWTHGAGIGLIHLHLLHDPMSQWKAEKATNN